MMNSKIKEFIQFKKLAVVGVSSNPQKFGSAIYTELKQRGFEVYGVNPHLTTIGGDPCYASIKDLAGKVDGAILCLQPSQAAQVIRDAAAAGITNLWLQQGSQSLETKKAAQEAGVQPVEGKCILMYAGEVSSIHNFHKFFAKLFGQY